MKVHRPIHRLTDMRYGQMVRYVTHLSPLRQRGLAVTFTADRIGWMVASFFIGVTTMVIVCVVVYYHDQWRR